MPRLARLTIPGLPHHVTQRGNRRQPVFFHPDDRQTYLRLLLEQTRRYRVAILAYCLMDNHVHFIATPQDAQGLARAFGETHRRYTTLINGREGWSGYLWQGRFASFPMEEQHLYAATRYVERNPVEAGMVKCAEDYPWSSARAHMSGTHDPILAPHPLQAAIQDWSAFLQQEAEEFEKTAIAHARTGRPLGDTGFVKQLEQLTGRQLQKQKVGRKPKLVLCPLIREE